MKYLFRVDSSYNIGSGHMMRCINLAKKLNGEIHFYCNNLNKNINFLVSENQFTLHQGDCKDLKLQEQISPESDFLTTLNDIKPNCVIIDHYGIGMEYESEILKHCSKVLVIDDLEREHDENVAILDQNYKEEFNYNTKTQFLGPMYTLLSDDFNEKYKKTPYTKCNNIIIYMGASDLGGITRKIYESEGLLKDINFHYLIGKNSQDLDFFKNLNKKNIYFEIDNMPKFLQNFDLFIGAGGTTSWERAFLGIASICIALSENQVPTGKNLHTKGVHHYLGTLDEFNLNELITKISELKNNIEKLNSMQKNSFELKVAAKFSEVLTYLQN